MPDIALTSLMIFLKGAAVMAGFLLAVRLLATGGRTADDRDRALIEAIRRRDRPAS